MSNCLRCTHMHSNVDGVCFVNLKTNGRDCDCDSQSYVPENHRPGEFLPEQYHFEVLQKMTDITQRVKYLIEAIEGVRNMTNWQFVVAAWRYFIGFKIGMSLNEYWFDRIRLEADPETLRRTRQKVCEPELEMLREFQERLQNVKEFSNEYWNITKEIKEFWKNAKYVPDSFDLLRAKRIKQDAIFEYSIMELNLI